MSAQDFELAVGQVLCFTFEFDVTAAPAVLRTTPEQLQVAAAKAIANSDGALKDGDLHCSLQHGTFDFQNAHGLPAPAEHLSHPLVMTLLIDEASASNKVYVAARVGLTRFEGLRLLYTVFNIIEALEGASEGGMTVLNTKTFDGFGLRQWGNYAWRLGTAFGKKAMGQFEQAVWPDANWKPNPTTETKEFPDREIRSYSDIPSDMTFRDVLAIFDKVKQEAGLSHVATTVNYAPNVGLAFGSSCTELATSAERRVQCLTMPPGPPPPFGGFLMTSDCILLNNYGKVLPKMKSQVCRAVWDWNSLPRFYGPVLFIMSLQDRLHVVANVPKPLWEQTSAILAPLGMPMKLFQAPVQGEAGHVQAMN